MVSEDETWEVEPLVRALRAPGTPEELAGEATLLSAYREAHAAPQSVRRLVGRFGLGATSAVAAVVLSAGVAAAYTQALPDPVQRIAHGVLGPVGVPAPQKQEPAARVALPEPSPTSSASTTPTATPTATPTRSPGPGRPSPTRAPAAPPTVGTTGSPADLPSPTPEPGATPTTGTTSPPRPVPAAVAVRTSSSRVPAGGTARVIGSLTADDGSALRRRTVSFWVRPVGGSWSKVGTARTDRAGRVSFTTPALDRTTRVRLGTPSGVLSEVLTVVVVPQLVVSVVEQGGTSTVTVSTTGAREGETVTAFRSVGGKLVRVGSARVGPDGSAVVSVPTPGKQVRLVLRLRGTAQHAPAQTSATIGG